MKIAQSQIKALYRISDMTDSYLSYDDATNAFEGMEQEFGDEWAEYHSIEKIAVKDVEDRPTQGCVWVDAEGNCYAAKGDVPEALYDSATLVSVEVR